MTKNTYNRALDERTNNFKHLFKYTEDAIEYMYSYIRQENHYLQLTDVQEHHIACMRDDVRLLRNYVTSCIESIEEIIETTKDDKDFCKYHPIYKSHAMHLKKRRDEIIWNSEAHSIPLVRKRMRQQVK